MPRRAEIVRQWAQIGEDVAVRQPEPLARRLTLAVQKLAKSRAVVVADAAAIMEEMVSDRTDDPLRDSLARLDACLQEVLHHLAAPRPRRRGIRRKS